MGEDKGEIAVSKHVVLGELLGAINKIKSLEYLAIHNAQLSPEQIKMMIGCPNMHTLDLSIAVIPRTVQAQFKGNHRVVFTVEPPD